MDDCCTRKSETLNVLAQGGQQRVLDRATFYGAFLSFADKLRGEERNGALALWQYKGKRAFRSREED